MKKIGLVSFGTSGGTAEYARQLKHILNNYSNNTINCQIIRIKGIKGSQSSVEEDISIGRKEKKFLETLKSYEHLIFLTISEVGKKDDYLNQLQSIMAPYSKELNYSVVIHNALYNSERFLSKDEIVANANSIIYTSENNKNYFENNPSIFNLDLKTKQSFVIHLPFDGNYERIEKKEKFICNTARIMPAKKIKEVLLFASYLRDYKIEFYGEIFKKSKGENGNLHSIKNNYVLGVMGKYYYDSLMKVIEENNLENVKFHDRLINREELLRKSKYSVDFFYHLDKNRVQYTTLESMKCGAVPIVHKNYSGDFFKEGVNCITVGEYTDVVYNQKIDYEKLKEKIESITEEEYKKIQENNYKFLEKYFTPEICFKNFDNFFNKVIKK